MIRFLDTLLSGVALVLLSPLLLAVMLVLRLTGEGEVFYRQRRIGLNGKPFNLLKFATMLKNSPNIGAGLFTEQNDPRVLPFGAILRNTKINELPQLLNVFLGDMSIIGPRPQAGPHFDLFPIHVRTTLMTVKPGLSGVGSIVFRDEEHILWRQQDQERFYGEVIAPYKGEIECWFIANRSVSLYLKLIALTVLSVLFPASRSYRWFLRGLPTPPIELSGL